MPSFDNHLTAVLQPFGDGTFLEEVVLFPEICCFGDDPSRLRRAVKNLLTRTMLTIPPGELYRRRLPGNAAPGWVEVPLSSPVHSLAWQHPVTLRLPVVRWSHPAPLSAGEAPESTVSTKPAPGPEAHLALVPALRIEVVAGKPDQLEAMLVEHVRTALMRTKATSLEQLVWLQRCREVQVVRFECAVAFKSPKQLAREEMDQRERPESVLARVGSDLTKDPGGPAYEMEATISRLVEILTGPEPRSVLLVGPSGVGKTAAVGELVRSRRQRGLGATAFWATTGSRLVSGMSGFGMWQERCMKLWREASHQKTILHLGNLLELMEVGKSEYQAQGIASFLRPYLSRGDLLTIAECTPEQLPLIERQEPGLLAVFAQLPVPEPSKAQSRAILEKYVLANSPTKMAINSEGLEQLDRLHRRYAAYSAYPGRPLKFVRNLLADRNSPRLRSMLAVDQILTAADVTREFARETGLPLVLLAPEERLDLAQTESWFAGRVMGQKEPVDLVVDLLATIKADLARPRKPIASLMFIGPTGVGKTEMAKALAEFLFGSKQRLTRFDMSEYADPEAVSRLVGGSFQGEGLLTARIREQPFSVLLLDEIEKAHPQLFDLLLQVLGDGRLTDAAGRVADFCNSVIIMTSNLGAESFQQGSPGLLARTSESTQAAESLRSREHFLGAVQKFFRPELFNRIDRIVPFAPLDRPTILHIAHRQLELVRQRDGIRMRGVNMDLAPEVASWLARRGFDSRYGARPLKRAIDRELLAPLAEKLNGYLTETPVRAHLRVTGDAEKERLHADVRAMSQDAERSLPQADAQTVTACMGLRRDLQKLSRSSAALEMDNEIHRLQFLEERARKGTRLSADEVRRLGRLAAWRQIRSGVDELFAGTCLLEDRALLAFLNQEPMDNAKVEDALQSARASLNRWMLALYLQRFDSPNDVVVAVFSEHPPFLLMLSEAYVQTVLASEGRVDVWQFLPGVRTKDEPGPLQRRLVLDARRLWKQATGVPMRTWDHEKKILKAEEIVARPMEGVIGFGLAIHAPAALPRFLGEGGLHYFRTAQTSGNCLVDTSEFAWQDYQPPPGMDRRGSIGQQARRRSYDVARGVVEDIRLSTKLYFSADNLPVVLASALEQCLTRNLQEILNS